MSSQPPPITGKALAQQFFTKHDKGDPSRWRCRFGKGIKQKGSGYTNLCNHIRGSHSNLLTTTTSSTCKMPEDLFYSMKTRNIFGWLCFIMLNLLPFSNVEKASIRDHVRYSPISLQTFDKYLDLLTKRVETHISSALPEKFAIIFDGWSSGDTHDVAVVASYNGDERNSYKTALLAFTPFEEESNLEATTHFELLQYVLGLFNKSFDNDLAVVGDNFSVNRCLAANLDCRFIGCWIHQFNLGVRDFIESIPSDVSHSIESIQEIMRKLRTIKRAAKLRNYTVLKAKLPNATR